MLEISMKIQMDCTNKIDTFEEVSMTDPFNTKKSLNHAILLAKTIDFLTNVYPKSVINLHL
jgi:hypothetical protein